MLNTNKLSILKQLNSSQLLRMAISTSSAQCLPRERSSPIKLTSLLGEHVPLYAKKKEVINYNEDKFYDPPYLNKEPPFPNYELLNINIHGYDFAVLDTYYKYLERLCNSFKVNVVEAYAMPCRSFKIKTYQPFSSNLDKEYKLNNYHRVVRIKNLKSTLAPFLFETIELNLPEGVQLSVTVPTVEEDEFRYVPDIELNELKQKLAEYTKKPYDPNAKK